MLFRSTDKRRDGFHQLPDVTGFAPAHPFGLHDNPNSTARRKWHSRWESNPYLPDKSGCSLAVELRGDQMDKWRDRAEALHAGNRTRTAKACATDGTPSLLVEDNRSTSAHRNGQEVGICTRTVSFTGRDAARYTTILRNGVHGRNCTCDLRLRRAALSSI